MKTQHFKFSGITRARYNPRQTLKPSDPEYGEIRNSIAEFGMVGGLVVNTRTNPPTLVGGHQRITILEDMGQDGADMVAVEMQSRNCLGMELSRGHPDAIVRRFAETYERVAIKRNGKKFDPASVGAEA